METTRTGKLKIDGIKRIASGITGAMGKLASPLWKTLTYSPLDTVLPLSVICISITAGRVDLIHAKRVMSRYRIILQKTYNHAEHPFPSPDDTAADAALFMKEAGLVKSDAVLVVPRSWMIVKSVELPSAALENLAEVMSYEFDRFTPLSASDAAYDYFSEMISPDRLGVFLAATRASMVNEYSEKLAAKAVSLKRIGFDISALASYCRFVCGLKSAFFAGISDNKCEGGFWENGILKAVSFHELVADDDCKKAEEVEGFISGLKKTENENTSQLPVLLSFSEESSGIRSALSSRANIPFRSTAEFGGKIKRDSASGPIQNIAAGGAIEYLNPKIPGFNLLSKGARQGGKKSYILSYILVGLIAACFAAAIFVPVKTERDRLEKIEKHIAQRKSEVAAIEKIRGEMEAINKQAALMDGFKGSKPTRIDLVKELTEVIPKNAWLTRVRIVGDKINIEGYALSATSLVQLLEASKFFKSVEFASPTFRDPQMNMDRFQIKMEVEERKKEGVSSEKQ
jgi:Tfp pilus assembly protein PilN